MLADVSDTFDSPNTGEYKLYPGGTPLPDAMDGVNALATVALQKYSTVKTTDYIQKEWGQKTLTLSPSASGTPMRSLQELSKLTGKPIPAAIEAERGRVVDAMVDSHPYVHGKRFALVGDPDILLGMMSLIMEMGGEPVHVICTNGDKHFEAEAKELLASSPFGANGKVYAARTCGIFARCCSPIPWTS